FMEIVFNVTYRSGEFLRQAPRHDDAGDAKCAPKYLLDLLLSVIECFETDGGVNYRSDWLIEF
ncbi:MAG: hypothetical protein WBZ16_08605, partial [Pseudolabrys sp.]